MSISPGVTAAVSGPECPSGSQVISGGLSVSSHSGLTMVSGYPHMATNRWAGSVRNEGSAPATVTVQSVCLPVGAAQ